MDIKRFLSGQVYNHLNFSQKSHKFMEIQNVLENSQQLKTYEVILESKRYDWRLWLVKLPNLDIVSCAQLRRFTFS